MNARHMTTRRASDTATLDAIFCPRRHPQGQACTRASDHVPGTHLRDPSCARARSLATRGDQDQHRAVSPPMPQRPRRGAETPTRKKRPLGAAARREARHRGHEGRTKLQPLAALHDKWVLGGPLTIPCTAGGLPCAWRIAQREHWRRKCRPGLVLSGGADTGRGGHPRRCGNVQARCALSTYNPESSAAARSQAGGVLSNRRRGVGRQRPHASMAVAIATGITDTRPTAAGRASQYACTCTSYFDRLPPRHLRWCFGCQCRAQSRWSPPPPSNRRSIDPPVCAPKALCRRVRGLSAYDTGRGARWLGPNRCVACGGSPRPSSVNGCGSLCLPSRKRHACTHAAMLLQR